MENINNLDPSTLLSPLNYINIRVKKGALIFSGSRDKNVPLSLDRVLNPDKIRQKCFQIFWLFLYSKLDRMKHCVVLFDHEGAFKKMIIKNLFLT